MGHRRSRFKVCATGVRIALASAVVVPTSIVAFDIVDRPTAEAASLDVCETVCTYSAIQDAINAAVPGDEVTVAAGVYGERLVIPVGVTPLTITGAGNGTGGSGVATMIDGEALGTVVTVPDGVDLTVNDLVITNGRGIRTGGPATGLAGGIANEGALTMRRVVLADNVAEDSGGGIHNSGGTVLIEDSVISNNHAGDPVNPTTYRGFGGGGILNLGSTSSVTIRRSFLIGNRSHEPTTDFRGGGAINSTGGAITIEDSYVDQNSAGFSSGAIDVRGSTSSLLIRRSTISNNRAEIAGGIQTRSSASVEIHDSTFEGNAASNVAGALRIQTIATITNSTVSGNSAGRSGGGIDASNGALTLDSVTIVGNSAQLIGGLAAGTSPGVVANNSIIANNTGHADYPDCWGTVTATTPVLVGTPSTCVASGSPLLTGDPQLGPLGENGGPTLTHEPLTGSPLVDAGATALTNDQRGLPRPSGSQPDIGAVELQTTVDATPPEFGAGSLKASELQPESVRLTWTPATDDVSVTGYEIEVGKVVVTTAGPAATTTVVSGLAPETTSTFTVVAVDAAGNRSTDGPSTTVTTPPIPPSGHTGPSGDSADLSWTEQIPFSLVEQASSLGEIAIIASAGSSPRMELTVEPGTVTPVDLDGDRVDDMSVLALPRTSGLGPELDVEVRRLPGSAPTDVEVIAILDLGVLPGALLPTTFVNGFRTLDADGRPGGTLPDIEVLKFTTDEPVGLDHRIEYGFDTKNPSGQMVFFAGVVEGSARVASGAANVVSMHLDTVPTSVSTTLEISATDIGLPEDAGFVVDLRWDSPASEPRPKVVFAYGEREERTKVPAEHDTVAIIDPIPPQTRLTLDLTADPAPNADQGHLTLDGASSTHLIDEVSVEHRRADGVIMRGGFAKIDRNLRLAVTADGDLTLGDSGDPDTRLFFELHNPGGDFFGGSFAQPITTIFASLRDRSGTTTATSAADVGADIRINTSGYAGGEFVLVATSDNTDHGLGGLGGVWPSSHPLNWSYDTSWSRPAFLRVGVIDDGTRSTLALHANKFQSLDLTLAPETLSQLATIEVDADSELDVDMELAPGTPLGGPDGTTMRCTADVGWGAIGLTIEPPTTYGLNAERPLTDVACTGERGDTTATFAASTLPAVTTIDLVGVTDDSGRVEVHVDSTLATDKIHGLDIEVVDPTGLLPAGLLGTPATYIRMRGTGMPSAAVDWSSTSTTDVVIESLHQEDPIDRFEVIIASDIPAFTEDQLAPPPGVEAGAADITDWVSSLRVWDTGRIQLIAGSIRSAHRVALQHRESDGGINAQVEAAALHRLITQLFLPQRGHFSPVYTLNGGCTLVVPEGLTEADIVLDEEIRLTSDLGFDPQTTDALACRQVIGGGRLGDDVRVSVDAVTLPPETVLRPDSGSLSIRTTGGSTGAIEMAFATIAPSPGSRPFLPGVSVFGRGAAEVGALVDGVVDADLTWTDDRDGFRVVLDTLGNPIERAGAQAATHSLEAWQQTTGHSAGVTMRGADENAFVMAELVDPADVELLVTPGTPSPPSVGTPLPPSPPTLSLGLVTGVVHPLDVEISTTADTPLSPGFDIDATLAIGDIPGQVDIVTDLESSFTLDASDGIDSIDVDAVLTHVYEVEVDDNGSTGIEERRDVYEVFVEASDLPAEVELFLDRLASGSFAPIVEALGMIGVLDVVIASGAPGGLGGRNVERARVRVEDLPDSLSLSITRDGPEGSETIEARGVLGGGVGRILAELTGKDMFDTKFDRFFVQLVDVPDAWNLFVDPDPDSDDLRVVVATNSSNDAIGRLEVQASRGTVDDPGEFLEKFADPETAAVLRGRVNRNVDIRYFEDGDRRTLDSLFGVGVPLPIETVPVAVAPDGAGGGTRTAAKQDHVAIEEMGPNGPGHLSVGLSDVRALTFTAFDGTTEFSLLRPPAADPGGLFVGQITKSFNNYCCMEALLLPEYAPLNPDGSPELPHGKIFYSGWREDFVLGYRDGAIGWSGLAGLISNDVNLWVEGETSGARARLRAVDGENPAGELTLDHWNGVDFVDGEPLVVDLTPIGNPVTRTAVADVSAQWSTVYPTLWLGNILAAEENPGDLTTFRIVEQPTRGEAYLDGRTVKYRPDRFDFLGHDAFRFEICTTEGICAQAWYGIHVAEFYDRLQIVQFVDPPADFSVTVRPDVDSGQVVGPGIIEIGGSEHLGFVEYFDGPMGPLATDPDIELMRIRADIDSRDLLLDFADVNAFLPGRLAFESSGTVELVGMTGSTQGDRTVFGVRGEDLKIQTKMDGIFVDDATNDLADYEGSGECDDIVDWGCWLMFRIGAEVHGRGDTTGRTVDGFVAFYELVDLEASVGGGRDYVPRVTMRFDGLSHVDVGLEIEIDMLCLLTCDIVWPLDVETDLAIIAAGFDFGFWDRGFDVCLPGLSSDDWDGCIDVDEPDYVNADPWTIGFPSGPFGLGLFPPPDAGALTFAATTLRPGESVQVVLPAGTDTYQIMLYSDPMLLASGVANGATEVTVTIPVDAEPGSHTLVLFAESEGELRSYSAPLTVESAPTAPPEVGIVDEPATPVRTPVIQPTIPPTGGSTRPLLLIALALVALGAGLTRVRRRST